MRVKYYLNDRQYAVHPCPKCASIHLAFDAGMLAGVIMCKDCGYRVLLDDIFACMREWGCDNVPLSKEEKHALVVAELRVSRRENDKMRYALRTIADGQYGGASYMAQCALQKVTTDD